MGPGGSLNLEDLLILSFQKLRSLLPNFDNHYIFINQI